STMPMAAAAELNDLPHFTVITLAKPPSPLVNTKYLVSKHKGTTADLGGWSSRIGTSAGGTIYSHWGRGTSSDIRTGEMNGVLTPGQWNGIASSFGSGDDADIACFWRDLAAGNEDGPGSVTAAGSGTHNSDAAVPLEIGRRATWNDGEWSGEIAAVIIVARRLTIGEVRDWVTTPRVIPGTILFLVLGLQGVTAVRDLSGAGTVTTALTNVAAAA